MNAQLPQLDLPLDYVVGNNVTEDILNFYKQTCRLNAGIFVLCLEGSLKAFINLTEYHVRKNDFITLMPGSIIQFCGQTEKVRLSFIGFSSKFMERVNIIQSSTNFLPLAYENAVLTLNDNNAGFFRDYFSLMDRVQAGNALLNPEVVKHILLTIVNGIGGLYTSQTWPKEVGNRSEEICKQFIQLVMENYTTHRHTAFYASRLSISSQHLCMIIKQRTGRSVSDIIAEMVIMDAKSQLKATSLTIQEISYTLNFPNVSFFGKYFKRYVGVSPQKFRKGS